jgi:hypothetical protein
VKLFENFTSIFINEATAQLKDNNLEKLDDESREQYNLIGPKITQLVERMTKNFRI